MRTVLARYGFLAFVVINGVIALGLEGAVRGRPDLFMPGSGEFSKSMEALSHRAADTRILFLGDSKVYYGVNPEAMPEAQSAHNFSFAGENIECTYWKLSHVLRRGMLPRLTTVVVGIELARLVDPDMPPQLNYYPFIPVSALGGAGGADVSTRARGLIMRYSFAARAQPTMLFLNPNHALLGRLQHTGYSRRDSELSVEVLADALETQRTNFEQHATMPMEEAAIGYYRRLKGLLDEYHVRLVFMRMPESLSIASRMGLLTTRAGDFFEDRLGHFLKAAFPGVPYLNYLTKDSPFEREQWSDFGHLNYKGSLVFGPMVSRDLARLEFPQAAR